MESSLLAALKAKSIFLIDRRRQDILDSLEQCNKDTASGDVHSRIIEREGRRRRRREYRTQTELTSHYEGQSSDDEILQSMESKFQSEIG